MLLNDDDDNAAAARLVEEEEEEAWRVAEAQERLEAEAAKKQLELDEALARQLQRELQRGPPRVAVR